MADRLLTKTVRQIIPESESYMELLEVEKKLDLVLMRKRLTLQESLKQPLKVHILFFFIAIMCAFRFIPLFSKQTKRVLRVMLSSAFKPGSPDTIGPDGQSNNDGCPPGWELKVEGQLLEKVHSCKPPNYRSCY